MDRTTTSIRETHTIPIIIDGQIVNYRINVSDKFTISGGMAINDTPRSKRQIAAVQQRLNYLGFRDSDGNVLAVDGIIGPKTSFAIRQFKATTDPTGTSPVSQETEVLDQATVNRLNAIDAPRWTEFFDNSSQPVRDLLGNLIPNRYTTNWLANALRAASVNSSDVKGLTTQIPLQTESVGMLAKLFFASGLATTSGINRIDQLRLSSATSRAIPQAYFVRDQATKDLIDVPAKFLVQISNTVPSSGEVHVSFQPPRRVTVSASDRKALSTGIRNATTKIQPSISGFTATPDANGDWIIATSASTTQFTLVSKLRKLENNSATPGSWEKLAWGDVIVAWPDLTKTGTLEVTRARSNLSKP